MEWSTGLKLALQSFSIFDRQKRPADFSTKEIAAISESHKYFLMTF